MPSWASLSYLEPEAIFKHLFGAQSCHSLHESSSSVWPFHMMGVLALLRTPHSRDPHSEEVFSQGWLRPKSHYLLCTAIRSLSYERGEDVKGRLFSEFFFFSLEIQVQIHYYTLFLCTVNVMRNSQFLHSLSFYPAHLVSNQGLQITWPVIKFENSLYLHGITWLDFLSLKQFNKMNMPNMFYLRSNCPGMIVMMFYDRGGFSFISHCKWHILSKFSSCVQ